MVAMETAWWVASCCRIRCSDVYYSSPCSQEDQGQICTAYQQRPPCVARKTCYGVFFYPGLSCCTSLYSIASDCKSKGVALPTDKDCSFGSCLVMPITLTLSQWLTRDGALWCLLLVIVTTLTTCCTCQLLHLSNPCWINVLNIVLHNFWTMSCFYSQG